MCWSYSRLECFDYLQNGIWWKTNCKRRHRKICRYWARSSQGCRRGSKCKYLHQDLNETKARKKNKLKEFSAENGGQTSTMFDYSFIDKASFVGSFKRYKKWKKPGEDTEQNRTEQITMSIMRSEQWWW